MKIRGIIMSWVLAVIVVGMFDSTTAFAAEISESEFSYELEAEEPAIDNAEILSEKEYVKDGRKIIITTYEQEDGTIIVDTLNVGVNMLRSSNGSDTATRTRSISQWGTITITASFDWYTEGLFSYVRCSGMSANYSMDEKAECSKWETSRTSNYVSIGRAEAQVNYRFHNSAFPAQYQEGTFKITCTDKGSITDNG